MCHAQKLLMKENKQNFRLPVNWIYVLLSVFACTSCISETIKTECIPVGAAYKEHSLMLEVKDTPSVALPPQVPVLCYHQIRNWEIRDSRSERQYIVPVRIFAEHMRMLRDSGYHIVLPDQLAAYLQYGKTLPDKSVMLTFDDGTISQFDNALPLLDKYGFKATFFIMTVTLDKPGYLSREQIRMLATQGHAIGCHTWDHHKVTTYTEKDWTLQLTQPTLALEQLSGKPVHYFAYPYGVWNVAAIGNLRKQGYIAAFQLGGRRDADAPLFTIRRLIADGRWSGPQLATAIKRSFR